MGKAVAIAATASAARRIQWVMMGMAMTLLAALSLAAWSQPAPTQPAMGASAGMAAPQHGDQMGGMHGWGERHGMGGHHGMGGMHHGMGGTHHGMGGGMMFRGSPEHMGRMIDHMLDGLNATDAQRGQIKQIATGAAADLKAQREGGRALRQRAMQAFTAPTVDAAASVTIQRADAVTETILRRDIAQISGSGLSLMPDGLEAAITVDQMADLIAFLSASP
jgi:hypothetical protein